VKATDKLFAGSIPVLYDRYLGPMIFAPYATDLAARAAALRPARVLETACGTGIVTRALRQALPATAEIVATDLNQPMLDYAATAETLSNTTWQQATAQALPFDDASFDLVVCQFGVMFFPDKPTAYAQARRVLKPGGTFLFNVWDRIEENPFPHVVTQSIAALYPDDPPRFMERTPHGHFDTKAIEADLRAAGFTDIHAETVARTSRAASARDVAIGFCQGTPFRNEIESRAPGRLDELTQIATDAVTARFGAGAIEDKIQAIVFEAR
jgi:ubiquinone/menaquinone biosynthesis C-methylase UbiE